MESTGTTEGWQSLQLQQIRACPNAAAVDIETKAKAAYL